MNSFNKAMVMISLLCFFFGISIMCSYNTSNQESMEQVETTSELLFEYDEQETLKIKTSLDDFGLELDEGYTVDMDYEQNENFKLGKVIISKENEMLLYETFKHIEGIKVLPDQGMALQQKIEVGRPQDLPKIQELLNILATIVEEGKFELKPSIEDIDTFLKQKYGEDNCGIPLKKQNSLIEYKIKELRNEILEGNRWEMIHIAATIFDEGFALFVDAYSAPATPNPPPDKEYKSMEDNKDFESKLKDYTERLRTELESYLAAKLETKLEKEIKR